MREYLFSAAFILGAWMLYKRSKYPQAFPGLFSFGPANPSAPAPQVVISLGSKGPQVAAWQAYLNEKLPTPWARLQVDGIFGQLTQNATRTVAGKDTVTLGELNGLMNLQYDYYLMLAKTKYNYGK